MKVNIEEQAKMTVKEIVLYQGKNDIQYLYNAINHLEKHAKVFNVPVKKPVNSKLKSLDEITADFIENKSGYIDTIPLLYRKLQQLISQMRNQE